MINAPVGFRFSPTNEELARYYLANRVAGNSEDLWRGLIIEFDMYTEEPWELWGRFYGPNLGANNLVEAKSDKFIYLFTTLKKVSSDGNGKKVNRRVGKTGGTWHGQNAKKNRGEGGFSWCERHFSYKNDKLKDQDGAWLMTEICFHDDDSLVLCRIGKKPPRVDDDNFMVQGTKAKRTRTEGMFRGSGIRIVGGEQVQPHGGVGCGFGNQRSENMGVPYNHGIDQDQGGNALFNPTIDQNQGGDGTIFNPIRTDEVGAMHMGIPYHHGYEFDSSNPMIDGSFPSTSMEIMNMIQMGVEANISSTLSDPVLIESGLLAPKSIRVHENLNHEEIGNGIYATMNSDTRMQEEVDADMGINALDDLNGNPVVEGDTPIGCNIGEPDHEDNVDILDRVEIVVGDMDELEEAMRATFPEYCNNINSGPITRIQEEEDKGIGTNCDNDINLPWSTDWSDLDQCTVNSLDEWIAELQRGGEQSPVQQMPRPR